MIWTIDETGEGETKLSPVVETFIAPPPFVLPESIRKSIRDLVELQDLEWLARHPVCVRRERNAPTPEGRWGAQCPRCFSEVPAYVTIGNIEHALSLYRALEAAPLGRAEFAATVGAAASRLKEAVADLDRMVAGGWDQLFFVRDQLARELPSLLRLLQTMDEVATTAGEDDDGGEVRIAPRDAALARVLAEVLANGGLPCFLEESNGTPILSPGFEILQLCLDQAGLHLSNDMVADLLHSTS